MGAEPVQVRCAKVRTEQDSEVADLQVNFCS